MKMLNKLTILLATLISIFHLSNCMAAPPVYCETTGQCENNKNDKEKYLLILLGISEYIEKIDLNAITSIVFPLEQGERFSNEAQIKYTPVKGAVEYLTCLSQDITLKFEPMTCIRSNTTDLTLDLMQYNLAVIFIKTQAIFNSNGEEIEGNSSAIKSIRNIGPIKINDKPVFSELMKREAPELNLFGSNSIYRQDINGVLTEVVKVDDVVMNLPNTQTQNFEFSKYKANYKENAKINYGLIEDYTELAYDHIATIKIGTKENSLTTPYFNKDYTLRSKIEGKNYLSSGGETEPVAINLEIESKKNVMCDVQSYAVRIDNQAIVRKEQVSATITLNEEELPIAITGESFKTDTPVGKIKLGFDSKMLFGQTTGSYQECSPVCRWIPVYNCYYDFISGYQYCYYDYVLDCYNNCVTKHYSIQNNFRLTCGSYSQL